MVTVVKLGMGTIPSKVGGGGLGGKGELQSSKKEQNLSIDIPEKERLVNCVHFTSGV